MDKETLIGVLQGATRQIFSAQGEALATVYHTEGDKVCGGLLVNLEKDQIARVLYQERSVFLHVVYVTEAWTLQVEKGDDLDVWQSDEPYVPVSEHPARREVVLMIYYGKPNEMWQAPINRPADGPAVLGPWEKVAAGGQMTGRMIDPPVSTTN
jgi:hypothetical protein